MLLQKVKEVATTPLKITFVILIGILISPLLILLSPFIWLNNRNYQREYEKLHKEYEEYLKTELEGKNFFCYNNRKDSFQFINEQILPTLSAEIEPIFLNGKSLESEKYEAKFLSIAFYEFTKYVRFPHLLKIRDGKAIDCSVNNLFYQVLNQKKDVKLLFNEINKFFEINY